MSADLFAAFGDAEERKPQSTDHGQGGGQKQSIADIRPSNISHQFQGLNLEPQPSQQYHGNDGQEDDFDDFGDFESAGQTQIQSDYPVTRPQAKVPTASGSEWDAWDDSSTTIPDRKTKSAAPVSHKVPATTISSTQAGDVLFDAEDSDTAMWEEAAAHEDEEDDDDDFGDFEGSNINQPVEKPPPTSTPSKVSKNTPMDDLLGLDSGISQEIPVQQKQSPARTQPPPKPKQALEPQPKAQAAKRTTKPPPPQHQPADEAWDDFDTISPTQSAKPTPFDIPADPAIALPSTLLTSLKTLTTPHPPSATSTSNIPPPSLLLSSISSTLTTLSKTFLHPLSILPTATKSTVLRSPQTTTLLSAYITLSQTLARVLAGRKSRWKRDKLLSQSMSIGPSVSGRSGGMKLAGLDKSENAREEQEVAEVVRVWKLQAGRLKTVVAGHNALGTKKVGPVPEVSGVMAVRTVSQAQGGVGGGVCKLCGLERRERVGGHVDDGVEDSFGEYWVEEVGMHRGCFGWWEGFKDELKGRG